MTLGTKGVEGEEPDTFNGPTDVAIAANGDIFVTDGHFNNRVVKFSKDGTFLKTWGSKGTEPGQFDLPHTIAIDSQGRLFVGDRSNARIQIFDQEGTLLDEWEQFGMVSGIMITADDTIYVADYQQHEALLIGSAKDGTIHTHIEPVIAEGITIDRMGNVYAAEVAGRILTKFEKQ
jgi:sugar lactone lactonase YvrE